MKPNICMGTEIRLPANIPNCNSFEGYIERMGTRCIEGVAQITGNNETVVTNVFQYTGVVEVTTQWAIITDATALTNATNVYATTYDGTNSVNLTADGITLSGVSVGSFFTKDQVAAQTYTLHDASQVGIIETLDDRKAGRPFVLIGKNGVTNYIRFHVTTNTTLDFSMFVHFEYQLYNGATLSLVT